MLPVFFCTGVAAPSAREREGVPTDLLLPVCTAGEAQVAGLDADAIGDAFALPCIAILPVEGPVLDKLSILIMSGAPKDGKACKLATFSFSMPRS